MAQAQDADTEQQTFSEICDMLNDLIKEHRADFPGKEVNRTQMLLDLYGRSGMTEADGEPVCYALLVVAVDNVIYCDLLYFVITALTGTG